MANGLAKAVSQIIPGRYKTFGKLRGEGKPYYFEKWIPENGNSVLHYWFWSGAEPKKSRKQVFISELEQALKHCLPNGNFSNAIFSAYCANTKKGGPCGFAVMGRCLEYLKIAEYQGQGKGFKITDRQRAERLLQS